MHTKEVIFSIWWLGNHFGQIAQLLPLQYVLNGHARQMPSKTEKTLWNRCSFVAMSDFLCHVATEKTCPMSVVVCPPVKGQNVIYFLCLLVNRFDATRIATSPEGEGQCLQRSRGAYGLSMDGFRRYFYRERRRVTIHEVYVKLWLRHKRRTSAPQRSYFPCAATKWEWPLHIFLLIHVQQKAVELLREAPQIFEMPSL